MAQQIQFMNNGQCDDPNDTVSDIMKTWICAGKVIEEEEIRTKFQNADLTNTRFGSSNPELVQGVFLTDFSNADFNLSSSLTALLSSYLKFPILNPGMSSLYQRKLEHFGYEMENTEIIKLTTLDEYCVKNNCAYTHSFYYRNSRILRI